MQPFDFEQIFQSKLLSLMLRDPVVVPYWRQLIKAEYFTEPLATMIVNWLYYYYGTYYVLPSRAALRQSVYDNPKLNKSQENINAALIWLEDILNVEIDDKDFILDKVKEFCTIQEYTLATLMSVEQIKKKQPKEIPDIFRAAEQRLNVTQGDFGIFTINMNIETRSRVMFSRPLRDVVLTPWASVNHACEGLAKKELFIILAPTGVGKTWLLCALAAEAMKQGKFVIFYTCELNERLVALRIYQILSGRSRTEILNDPLCLEPFLSQYQNQGAEILIKDYPSGSASVNDIRDHITRTAIQVNKQPDVVIIDYLDLLRTPGGSYSRNEEDNVVRHKIADLYRSTRRIGEELNIAMISASQTKQEAHFKENISITDFAEAQFKAQISDVAWALAQTKDEADVHRGRLINLKNRNDVKGFPVGLNLDYAHGIIAEDSVAYSPNSSPNDFMSQLGM